MSQLIPDVSISVRLTEIFIQSTVDSIKEDPTNLGVDDRTQHMIMDPFQKLIN